VVTIASGNGGCARSSGPSECDDARAVDRAKASKRGKLAQFADDSSLEEMDSNLNRSAPFLIKQCRSHDGLKGLATRNRTITSKGQINEFSGTNNAVRQFFPPQSRW
jgi:hypothetical protein